MIENPETHPGIPQATSQQEEKPYDLEKRTYQFARQVREFIRDIPRTLENKEDAKQLLRSSGAIGASYIEANEAFDKKYFRMRIKICRKDSKEARYWLSLIDLEENAQLESAREELLEEATALANIFGAIYRKLN